MMLAGAQCRPGAPALAPEQLGALLAQLPQWRIENGYLMRSYALPDFHAVMDFANALAPMIHQQDHHPDMTLSHHRCQLAFHTHSAAAALTENDFICAAGADAVFAARAGA
jgi:4a-hydroxytetrahydrobiopterin dehydratase